MSSKQLLSAKVARLVSTEELILNKGKQDGVRANMIFDIVDERTQDVLDPDTGQSLGSIERPKARVYVTEIGDRLSIAKPFNRPRTFGEVILAMSTSESRPLLGSNEWPEGVGVGDEAVYRGRTRRTQKPAQ